MTDLAFGNEFAINPEPRSACVLLVDTSGSMNGDPINQLNEGLKVFQEDIRNDVLASLRTEIAIVTFDSSVNLIQDFITADEFVAPELSVEGITSMGAGLDYALQLVENRKNIYKTNAVPYYRPSIFLITDGEPTDDIEAAKQALHQAVNSDRVIFYPIGVAGANFDVLRNLSPKIPPLRLKGLSFKEFFVWLSHSQKSVSASTPGEQVPLPSVDPWGERPS